MSSNSNIISISGIYLTKRDLWNNIIILQDAQKTTTRLDYFKFKTELSKKFGLDKSEKILDRLNCGELIIIDFDKNIAKLVIEKEVDFETTIRNYLTAEFVENLILEDKLLEIEDNLYNRTPNL
jgi:hypothetical protein